MEIQKIQRKSQRILSSLRDLTLEDLKNKREREDVQNLEQLARRKSKKCCPIPKICDDRTIYQNFRKVLKTKNKSDKELIVKSLSSHFIFSSLMVNKNIQENLLEMFNLCQVSQSQYLLKQNDQASSFFILHQGKLIVEINQVPKRRILPGEGFGQLALLYSAPRSASIRAEKSSKLWFIDRGTFKTVVSTIVQKNFKENFAFIKNNKFFTYLSQDQKSQIASIGISQRFQKNQKICKQKQLASSIYILKSGKLSKHYALQNKGTIKVGQIFDQYVALDNNCLRKYTIIALEDSQIIAMSVKDIENVLGKSLPIMILRNRARQMLLKSPIFKQLENQYLEKVLNLIKVLKVNSNQIIIKKGYKCRSKIFFVIEGHYQTSEDQQIDCFFGIDSMKENLKDSEYSFDLQFKSTGKIAAMDGDEIQKILGLSLQKAINKGNQMRQAIERYHDRLKNLKKWAQKTQLADYFYLKKLGQGQFGVVYLVCDKEAEKFFALKCISKYETIKNNLEKYLLNQKKALQQIKSPFIVEYIRSYKDNNFIYFLMEFINGVELFQAIRMIGLLSLQQARFYTAILFNIIESLHYKAIIYRDLKPQNIIVDSDGYLKLIDMGTCKIMSQSISQKTFTIIGTPNYMAPEILGGKGYTFTVDLWSLGVILYEFLAGYVPFGEDTDDPYLIYQEILTQSVKFPKNMKDQYANDFINIVLNKNPQARLKGSYSILKNHPFFSKIDWNKLIQRKFQSPFKLPQKKLVNVNILKNNMRNLEKVIKNQQKPSKEIKTYNENWDNIFGN